MNLSLPPWPMERVITEAVRDHNLVNFAARLDSEKSPWPALSGATLAFLRHAMTGYDWALNESDPGDTEGLREALQAEIAQLAHRHYSWLRPDKDPRALLSPPTKPKALLPFNFLSAALVEHFEIKDLMMRRYKQLPKGTPEHLKKKVRERIGEIAGEIAEIERTLEPAPSGYVKTLGFSLDWEGCTFPALPQSALEYLPIACPHCKGRIERSKRAVNFGQGRRVIFNKCACICVAEYPAVRRNRVRITQAFWVRQLRGVNYSSQPDGFHSRETWAQMALGA